MAKPIVVNSSTSIPKRLDQMTRFEHEEMMIAKSTSFTAVMSTGRHRYSLEADNIDSIKTTALKMLDICKEDQLYKGKSVLIYALNTFVGTMLPNGTFKERNK